MSFLVSVSTQLGPILRGLRKEKGLTQARLAARAGLLPKTVSGLENSPARASVESLMRYLAALEVELHLDVRSSDSPGPAAPEDW